MTDRTGFRISYVKLAVVTAVLLTIGYASYLRYLKPRLRPGTPAPGPAAEATKGTTEEPVGRTLLRIQGSNTMGAVLLPELAKRYLIEIGATGVKSLPGTSPGDGLLVHGTLPGESEPTVITVRAQGSSTAFEGLATGLCDIGASSRPVSREETAKLQPLGDMTSPTCEHVVAMDGIAIIVSRANSIDRLSLDQLSKVFSGEATDWSDIGGPAGRINVYSRDAHSGTFDTFRHLVLGVRSLAPSALVRADSNELSDEVARDPRSIGFVGIPFVRSAKPLAVYEGVSAPLRPSYATVKSEDYLLSRRLYLYVPAAPANPHTLRFVEFALSDKGQEAVRATGFVDLKLGRSTSAPAEPGVDDELAGRWPAAYRDLVRGAEKVAVIRFRSGSDALDSRAVADLRRFIDLVSSWEYEGTTVILVGHTDSVGGAAVNQKLSSDRAEVVRRELRMSGIRTGVCDGFGSGVPVAGDETAEGRQKNRRVEIWTRTGGL